MSDILTEALLEMHFHAALVEHFSARFGARKLRLLKPSPQNETWVGFDQGWVQTTMSTQQLFSEVKNGIKNKTNSISKMYLAFFLQFKKVSKVRRKSKYTPPTYKTPYYRCELSLLENPNTSLSQHETLRILSNIKNASVYYACGMLFDVNDIYSKPSLTKLRMVPIFTKLPVFLSTERHFITFQSETGNPFWCSEPIEGTAVSFDAWASGQMDNSPRPINGKELIELITHSNNLLLEASNKNRDQVDLKSNGENQNESNLLPHSLNVMEYEFSS